MPVLAEGMFFPVDIVMQPIPERSLKMAVFAQTFVIDHDLPSRTAGIRTGICDTGKLFIIRRECNLHKINKLL